MDELLFITIIGQDLLDLVLPIFEEMGINLVNPIKKGMLGNFKTFKYAFALDAQTAIPFRRRLMENLLHHSDILPLYEGGNWMQFYIFKRSAFKTQLIMKDL